MRTDALSLDTGERSYRGLVVLLVLQRTLRASVPTKGYSCGWVLCVILGWVWVIDLGWVWVMWVRIGGIGYTLVVTWVRLGGFGYVLGEALYGYAGFDAPERGDSVNSYLKVFVLIVV